MKSVHLLLSAGLFLAVATAATAQVEIRRDSRVGSCGAEFKLGAAGSATIELEFAEAPKEVINLTLHHEKATTPDPVVAKKSITTVLTNSMLRFATRSRDGIRLDYHLRPRPRRYTEKQQGERLEGWLKLGDATQRYIKFEARYSPRGTLCYIDDRYAGRLDHDNSLTALRFRLPEAGEVRPLTTLPPPWDDRFLPLNFAAVAQPGTLREATTTLPPGVQQVGLVPFVVAAGDGSGDIAKVRKMRGSWQLECDEYLSRNSFDNMPESQLLTVPQDYYHRAWILLAVDPDPQRDPLLIARLTRFAGRSMVGRGTAFADGYLTLPRDGERVPDNLKQVGSVNFTTNGVAENWPLYLAGIDLPLGEMQELIEVAGQDPMAELRIGPYLDFELLGRCGVIGIQSDGRRSPGKARSAAHVFGVTLERAPAAFRLVQYQPGNVFEQHETAQIDAIVTARVAGSYRLLWEISDVDGQTVTSDSRTLTLADGAMVTNTIPLTQPEVGHYKLRFTLQDGREQPLISHNAAFALLPTDSREATVADSPYGVWWFGGSHLTTRDLAKAGPLHLKAGIRRTLPAHYSEAEMAPYKLTLTTQGWKFRTADLDNFEAASKRVYTHTTNMLARYPSCQNAMIFHESHANTLPNELAGGKTQYDEKQRAANRRKAELANKVGDFYRTNFPQIKLAVGNTSGTAQIINDLLEFGFEIDKYADYIGIETPGQTFMPESISHHNIMAAWLAREVARQRGHDVPLTGCHEFTYRADRLIGAARQAEYYVRDILLSHAYNFQQIGPGTLEDAGSCYYNTLWGCAGLVERSPLFYPKPSYVAVATATRVMDRVSQPRMIPTGSLTVYALEMQRQRAEPDTVYAIWTPRGRTTLGFDFGAANEVELVDLYGRTRRLASRADQPLEVVASPAAGYLISPTPVRAITIVKHDYSADDPPPHYQPADPMDDCARWEMTSEFSLAGTFMRRGNFTMCNVDDSERGRCIEVELQPDATLPASVAEYTVMRLREPVPLPGQPHTVGVWVKGNSNWGRLFFELEDAAGRLWRCDGGYNDWPADLAVNFDGWRYLSFFIDPARSAVKNHSPGKQWRSSGGGTQPQYPLTLTALYVTMHQQAIDPVEMRAVEPKLRLQGIGAFE